jgi:hemerythrin-like metal-binding protein
MSIRAQILCSLGIMFLFSGVMCAASFIITLNQQDQGQVINLAGRQRIQVQKIAKESMLLAHQTKTGPVPAAQADVLRKNLNAIRQMQSLLVNGGVVQEGQRFEIPRPGPEAAKLFDEVTRQIKPFEADVDALLAKPDAAGAEKLAKSTEDVVAAQDKAVDRLEAESAAGDTTMLAIQGGGIVACALVFLSMLLVLRRTITQPLSRLQAFARTVAGGDLKAVADGSYPPELAQLRDDLSRMVTALEANMGEAQEKGREAMQRAAEADQALATAREQETRTAELLSRMNEAAAKARAISESVMGESSNLLAQAEQVARGAEHQRDRMIETATAMEEMNATVLEVARNASAAAASADGAKGKAITGAEGVRSAVASIETIRRRILELKESMTRLGQQADNIGHIMNVISDIADQTNLLALNAAIEAARAGDAGRGFAVVADEVRKLAEKTMTATKEVGDAVQSIQGQARENIAAVDSAAAGIEESTQAAAASGRFMDEIVGIVEETASQVESIATASEEQSATSEEINGAVEEVNRIAGETAEGMGAATSALSVLTELSSELDEVIRQMTGDDSASRRVVVTPTRRAVAAPTRPLPTTKALPARPKAAKALPAPRVTSHQPVASHKGPAVGSGGSLLQWDPSLEVGIKEIDSQHKILVQMICDLHEAMRTGQGKAQVERILKGLEDYTVEHFGHEEKLMEKYKYPGYLNHCKEHAKFVDKVVAFGNDFRANRAALTTEIMTFLKDWLVGHIKGIDKKYGHFFNERGIN